MNNTNRCNLCGRELYTDIKDGIRVIGAYSYGSKYDLNKFDLRLCIDCLDKLTDECVIKPFIGEYIP